MHSDCQVWAQPGWEGSYRTKTVFYIWQSPRRLGSCGADVCLGCVSYFCPSTVGISLSMPSAGSLIIMHMLMRLQEMSQFAACFASEPAYLLARVGKLHVPQMPPAVRPQLRDPSSSRTGAGRVFSVLRSPLTLRIVPLSGRPPSRN